MSPDDRCRCGHSRGDHTRHASRARRHGDRLELERLGSVGCIACSCASFRLVRLRTLPQVVRR